MKPSFRKLVKPDKYSIDYDTESLIEIYKRKWILKWVKDNHPEKIKEADKIIRDLLEEEDNGSE